MLDKIGIKIGYKEYVDGLALKGKEIILEFGCKNNGLPKELIKRLDKKGHLICADLSEESLAELKRMLDKHENVKCLIGDIRNIKLSNVFYDRIIINNIFFTIDEKERNSYVEYFISRLTDKGYIHIKEIINRDDVTSSSSIRQTMREVGLKEKEYAFIKQKGETVYIGTYER